MKSEVATKKKSILIPANQNCGRRRGGHATSPSQAWKAKAWSRRRIFCNRRGKPRPRGFGWVWAVIYQLTVLWKANQLTDDSSHWARTLIYWVLKTELSISSRNRAWIWSFEQAFALFLVLPFSSLNTCTVRLLPTRYFKSSVKWHLNCVSCFLTRMTAFGVIWSSKSSMDTFVATNAAAARILLNFTLISLCCVAIFIDFTAGVAFRKFLFKDTFHLYFLKAIIRFKNI